MAAFLKVQAGFIGNCVSDHSMRYRLQLSWGWLLIVLLVCLFLPGFTSFMIAITFLIWSAICFKIVTRYTCGFFPTYTCNLSCYTIYVRFFATYTCVLSCFVGFLFPSIWPFCYRRAYICVQKIPYICVTNKHVVYGVTERRRIRCTELYRQ